MLKAKRKLVLLQLWIVASLICQNATLGFSEMLVGDKEEKQNVAQLSLEITVDKDKYKVYEPIVLKCIINNMSKETIYLHPLLYNNLLTFLKHEDSESPYVFGPKILLFEIIKKEDIVKILQGDHYSFERVIDNNTYFMPTKLGRYELFAIYRNKTERLEDISLWTGEIKSGIVRFKIVE